MLRPKVRSILFVALALSLATTPVGGQGANGNTSEQDFTFRSAVANVRIDAQVVKDGDLVTGLAASDFEVYDEDALQQLTFFGREVEPLHLVLLLDVSGSMTDHIREIGTVARQSLRHLLPRDRVAVMRFARRADLVVPLTNNLDKVANSLRTVSWDDGLGSATELYIAIEEASKYLDQNAGETGRRAILVLTDNLGLSYQKRDDVVIATLNSANAVLNGIVVGKGRKPEIRPGTYTNPDFTPFDIFAVAEESGGETVRSNAAGPAFSRMIERIRTRYSLHYKMPQIARAGFRKVRVELTPAARMAHPGAIVRARKGYMIASIPN